MKILKIYYKNQRITLINIFLLLFLSNSIYSNDLKIEIQGNQFTDPDVIISLLKQVPENTDEEYSNYKTKVATFYYNSK